jgi:signal transduction histidine kinase
VDDGALQDFSVRPDERIAERLEAIFGPRSAHRFLGAPIIVRGRVRGLLALDRGTESRPDDQEEWLLSALADQTALAIEGAREEKERLALEARVDAMERNRSDTERALKMAGHDLRTPLNSMQGYLELLASGVFGVLSERQVDVVLRVQQIGRHLTAVLDSAFEMARLPTFHETLALADVSGSDVVSEAVAIVQPRAVDRQQRLAVDVDAELRLSADPDRLRQVLLHLLDNAVKYAPPDSTITVAGGPDDEPGWAHLTVADEGPGIPADHAEAIFEPGHRIAHGTDPGGTGLGLSIARGLIRQMGGDLVLRPGAGRGACFEVRLLRSDRAA